VVGFKFFCFVIGIKKWKDEIGRITRGRDVTFPCLIVGMEAWKKDDTSLDCYKRIMIRKNENFNYDHSLVFIFLIYNIYRLVKLQIPFVFIPLFGLHYKKSERNFQFQRITLLCEQGTLSHLLTKIR
jgi:hypothetical protein